MKKMKKLNKKQAIAFFDSGVWKDWNDEQIFKFQLFQDMLCVEWYRFHKSARTVLGRPVFTHEFASSNRNNLTQEYLRLREAPTMEEIVNLIPEDRRLIIGV